MTLARTAPKRNAAPARPAFALAPWALVAGLAAGLAFVPTVSAREGTFHVDRANPACSNSGPGTEAQPFCTISSAVGARGGPGAIIVVEPGVYAERVLIKSSGAEGSPMVLRAAAPGVVLDGAEDFSDAARWKQTTKDVWLAPDVKWSPVQVFAGGQRLTAAGAASALTSGSFFYEAGVGLHVNAGGGNPGPRGIRVGRREAGFSLSGRSWVTIEGFTIAGSEERGIYLNNSCSNITVLRNKVTQSAHYGIQAVGGSGIRIASNVISDGGNHGIGLTGGATACIVEDNESFQNARPGERAANGIYLFGAPANMLRGNRLHHNQDTGLHIQSGSNDCIAYLNRSWSNGDHGYDHLDAGGTIHVCDVAYGNFRDGFSIEGVSPGTELYNCIAIDNGLTTDHFNLWVDQTSEPGFRSNHNLFWNSGRQQPIKFIRTKFESLSAYSAASGRDGRSLQADPRFTDPKTGDFRLQPDSPAIAGAGNRGPGWAPGDSVGCSIADIESTLAPRRGQASRRP